MKGWREMELRKMKMRMKVMVEMEMEMVVGEMERWRDGEIVVGEMEEIYYIRYVFPDCASVFPILEIVNSNSLVNIT